MWAFILKGAKIFLEIVHEICFRTPSFRWRTLVIEGVDAEGTFS